MEFIENNFEIEHINLTDANYINLNINDRLKGIRRNQYGLVLSKIKLKNNDVYEIVLNSNSNDRATVRSYVDGDEKLDSYSIQEYFINGKNNYLEFSNESYCMVINSNEPMKNKYVFSDYRDAIGYLESLEK